MKPRSEYIYIKLHDLVRRNLYSSSLLEGALHSFGEEIQSQNFDIYNISEVMIQRETKTVLFF